MPTPDPHGVGAPVETDAELSVRLAVEAGQRLVELREAMWRDGAHAWDVMDHGDAIAHEFIAHELRTHRPDDAVLDEEGKEDPRRFAGGRVWIIDPLDGTREFGEPGRHDWAVHVALWQDDRFVAGAGVVARRRHGAGDRSGTRAPGGRA